MKVFSHSAIGVARKEIRPPVGIYARNRGPSNHDQSIGVHKPLTLTALALRDAADNEPLALLAMDGP